MSIFNKIKLNSQSVFSKKINFFFGNRIIDILLNFPKGIYYKNFKDKVSHSDIGELITIDLKITEHKENFNKKIPYKIVTSSKYNQKINILFFNMNKNYISNNFKIANFYRFTGKLGFFSNEFQIIHPKTLSSLNEIENFEEFEPIYELSRKKINKNLFRKLILSNVQYFSNFNFPNEWIDKKIIEKKKWMSFKNSILKIHLTDKDTKKELEKIRQRLAYDEILSSFLIFNKIKKKHDILSRVKVKEFSFSDNLISNLDFKLTNDQIRSIDSIRNDLKTKKMYRLIQGDVGSGKTIVSLLTILDVIKSGYQTVIMAPTEILANQHFEYFHNFLKEYNIRINLLTSKTKKKNIIYEKVENNKIDLLIGTHSVYNSSLKFKNLGLVVIDEQHKFGVQQRINLLNKSSFCHTLIMSATPIPRSLTFAIYGEISVSNIKTKPLGRKKIITSIISNRKINALLDGIKRKLEKNEQVFWVLPFIGENEEDENNDNGVISRFNFLHEKFKNNVVMLHGKLHKDQINENMKEFKEKKKMILVATTVIEVGINIPSASLIIIESANKFGLAQLHQLRGRISRNNLQSHCVFIYDTKLSDNAKQRLLILKNSNDGFKIAEEDLNLRGSGDVFGTNQSGMPNWRFFNPLKDFELVEFAKQNCEILIKDNNDNDTKKKFLLKVFFNDNNLKNFNSA